MQKPTVIFSDNNKSATVVAVNGAVVKVVAQDTLGVWFRKDGGVTLRTDAEHRSQTVRVDEFGRLTDRLGKGLNVRRSPSKSLRHRRVA